MEKTCNKCGFPKPESDYHVAARNAGGKHHTCKECRKKINDEYYKTSDKKQKNYERKRMNVEKMRDHKAKCGCLLCPEKEPVALDFHHKHENKEFNIATHIASYSWGRIFEEISKCVVLCSNCHRKLHAGLLELPCEESPAP